MASKAKAARAAKIAKKGGDVRFQALKPLRMILTAGDVNPKPPLGPTLTERSINPVAFCKEFNEKTANIIPGTPIPTRVSTNPDRTFNMTLCVPPVTYLIKRAAGLKKGAGKAGCETAGMISLKHIYEIAQVKKQDEAFEFHTLEQVCKKIIASCHTLGVKVVKEIDPKEYQTFLEERRKIEREEEERQEEIRIAKILRLKK